MSGEVPAWRVTAACRTAPPELFFPEDHIAPAGTKEWRAECEAVTRRWCLRCPSRLVCFAFSVEDEAEGAISRGIWGGVNFLDRKPWNTGALPVRCPGSHHVPAGHHGPSLPSCGTIIDPLPFLRLGEEPTCWRCCGDGEEV